MSGTTHRSVFESIRDLTILKNVQVGTRRIYSGILQSSNKVVATACDYKWAQVVRLLPFSVHNLKQIGRSQCKVSLPPHFYEKIGVPINLVLKGFDR